MFAKQIAISLSSEGPLADVPAEDEAACQEALLEREWPHAEKAATHGRVGVRQTTLDQMGITASKQISTARIHKQ